MSYPFPGMNPFLEHQSVWHDFHHGLMNQIRDALVPSIRPRYAAKVDENVYIHDLRTDQRQLVGRPDVAVFDRDPSAGPTTSAATIEPLAEGMLLPTEDRISEPFIEIRDIDTQELVTVIELLSPTNKRTGSDHEQYLAKRRQILYRPVHLVEIDLLRGGQRMPIENIPACDYLIMVSRVESRPTVGLWPLDLRDRLPKIPVPLASADADAVLDLQPLLEAQYAAAGYEDYIYRQTPQPLLADIDREWVEQALESQA